MILSKISAALILAAATLPFESSAFSPPTSGAFVAARGRPARLRRTASSSVLLAKKGDDEEDEDKREGMKDAFAALDALESLDDDESSSLSLGGKDMGMTGFDGTPEEEARLYKEMFDEIEAEGEEGMYSSIAGEMGGEGAKKEVVGSAESKVYVLDDVDGIGSGSNDGDGTVLTFKGFDPDETKGSGTPEIGEPDMDEFMEKALKEAVAEARSQTPDEIAAAGKADTILEDVELRKEISDLFDNANKKLVESVREIQEEQAALAKQSAKERQDAVEESEQRLAEAEEGVARLMENVVKETAEVERALADLKTEQEKMNADPLTKMADLKGGVAKQGAFVGLVLFLARTLGEVAQLSGPYGDQHATAAAVQGVIAAACAAYLALG